jgi:glycine/D-amino acid oxidase-like deaminating enzyme
MSKKQTTILIVGQGIAGTMLSWHFHQLNIPFLIVDDLNTIGTSAKVGTAIINPITGRRYVETWLIETLMPFAVDCYKKMEAFLGINIITKQTIAQFFATPQMEEAFDLKKSENVKWLEVLDKNKFTNCINSYNNTGAIAPSYTINMQLLLQAWQQYLMQQNLFINAALLNDDIKIENNNVETPFAIAEKIIWCNGVAAAKQKEFAGLPFALNKGEFLLIQTETPLTENYIFKQAHTIIPYLPKENVYWVGSSYVWDYDSVAPTELFYSNINNWLKGFLKVPFKIIAHHAAERPANIERRPFVGMHPLQPQIGLFNGLGAKGCVLAPFFANNFANYLQNNQQAIMPEAAIDRFQKIMERLQ